MLTTKIIKSVTKEFAATHEVIVISIIRWKLPFYAINYYNLLKSFFNKYLLWPNDTFFVFLFLPAGLLYVFVNNTASLEMQKKNKQRENEFPVSGVNSTHMPNAYAKWANNNEKIPPRIWASALLCPGWRIEWPKNEWMCKNK